jgi:ABC-type branched-subunit amino acid transport system ATPase component
MNCVPPTKTGLLVTRGVLMKQEIRLSVAAAMCERAVFMEKGAVRFEGPTADLLERDDIAVQCFSAR